MKTIRRLLILLVCWGASWWLVADAFSYGLSPEDPATGRARGCYTAIEEWLGLSEPSWIRTLEQILGAVLFLGVPLVILTWAILTQLKRRRPPDAA
jgi:hypothetical protein